MAAATDYTGLLTSEHVSKPKFAAMVAAVAQCFADQINVMQSIPAAFDLDTAVGVQLDAVGLWAGITRQLKLPLNVYFSLDTVNLGFDQGSWQGPFDPSSGLVSLDDATFRTLIRAKIAANSWDGTVPGAAAAYANLFAGSGSNIFIQDNQDMTMTVGVSGAIPSAVLRALISGGYLHLKPEGVRVNYYYVSSVNNTPLFGFDVQNQYVSGLDTGSWAVPA
jgi:RNAse (barnase) inhibitor barstar